MSHLLRHLPQVHALLDTAHIAALTHTYSRLEVAQALRTTLQDLRAAVQSGAVTRLPDFESDTFFAGLAGRIEDHCKPHMVSVINATGIIIHTNLGRARLSPEAIARSPRGRAGRRREPHKSRI